MQSYLIKLKNQQNVNCALRIRLPLLTYLWSQIANADI